MFNDLKPDPVCLCDTVVVMETAIFPAEKMRIEITRSRLYWYFHIKVTRLFILCCYVVIIYLYKSAWNLSKSTPLWHQTMWLREEILSQDRRHLAWPSMPHYSHIRRLPIHFYQPDSAVLQCLCHSRIWSRSRPRSRPRSLPLLLPADWTSGISCSSQLQIKKPLSSLPGHY